MLFTEKINSLGEHGHVRGSFEVLPLNNYNITLIS